MTRRPHTVSVGLSERARIPFALIGVLVLITSVSVVGVMQTRDDPEQTDVSDAMSQGEAAAQSVVREAVAEQLDAAAGKPVTVPVDTPAGRAIEATESDGSVDPRGTFRKYVKLRIYLAVDERLRQSEQRLSDGTVTEAELERIEYTQSSLENAIGRVDLTTADESSDLNAGMVKAEIEGLTVTAERGGEEVTSRTEDITVTVASTTFLLHDKVQTYQERMKLDFFESSRYGFSKRMTARLYPLMYAKAYYERMGPPRRSDAWKHMVMKKELEVLANDANFAVQRSVFGTQDPGADRVMAPAWACVAARNAMKMYDARRSPSGTSDSSPSGRNGYSEDTSASNRNTGASSRSGSYTGFGFSSPARTFCKATKMLFGGVSGNPPTSIQQVVNRYLGQQAQANFQRLNTGSQEVEVDKFADPAYDEVTGSTITFDADYESDTRNNDPEESTEVNYAQDPPSGVTDGDSYNDIIEDIYTYRVDTSTTSATMTSGSIPSATAPSSADGVVSDGPVFVDSNVDTTVNHDVTYTTSNARTRELHHFTIIVENRLTDELTYEECTSSSSGSPSCTSYTTSDTTTATFEVEISVEGTYATSSDVDVDKLDMTNPYAGGSAASPNFHEAVDLSIKKGVNVNPGDPDGNLAGKINTGTITSASDLQSQADGQITPTASIDYHKFFNDDDGTSNPYGSTTYSGEKGDLITAMGEEVTDLHSNVIDETVGSFSPTGAPPPKPSINPSPMEMATGSDVFEPLKLSESDYVYYDTPSGYTDPQQMAKVGARLQYVDAVNGWVDRVEQARSNSVSSANSQMSSTVDGSTDVLNQGLSRASDTIGSASTVTPGTVRSSTPLFDNIEYSVDGSPTYLAVTPVGRNQVPAVRPEEDTVADAGNTNHAGLTVRKHNTFGWPGMPIIPWPSYWYLSVDFWDIKVKGEYARFEVSATNTAPDSPRTTTYIRQAQPVTLEIKGQQRSVGEVDPIEFDSQTGVVIPVPGGTVYPKPQYGVGDDWRVSSSAYRNVCSSTWPHVGPGYRPSLSDPSNCDNLAGGVGGLGLTKYVPGSDTVTSLPLEVDDGELEFDSSAEVADECDEDTLEDNLNSVGTNRYESEPEPVRDEIVDTYCDLDKAAHRSMFEHLLGLTGGEVGSGVTADQVANDWIQMVLSMDDERIRNALDYLDDDLDGDGQPFGEEHEPTDFRSATAANAGESKPPHKEPGIVAEVETTEELRFARVYDSTSTYGPKGGWLAQREAVEGQDTANIIDDFALFDPRVMVESPDNPPWGEYDCIAKTFVPDDYPLRVSVGGGFSAARYDDLSAEKLERETGDSRLDGGIVQYELVDYPGGPMGSEDVRWVPMGSIENMADDPSALSTRWTSASDYMLVNDLSDASTGCGDAAPSWDPYP